MRLLDEEPTRRAVGVHRQSVPRTSANLHYELIRSSLRSSAHSCELPSCLLSCLRVTIRVHAQARLERHHAGASSAVPRASLGQELGKEPTSSYSFPPCAQRYGFRANPRKRVLSIDGFQTLYTYYIFPPLPYNRVACEACAFNVRRTHSSPRYSPKCQEKHRRCPGWSPVGVFATEFWRRGLTPVKG